MAEMADQKKKDEPEISAHEREVQKLKTNLTATRSELNRTVKRELELRDILDRFSAIKPADQKVPKWMRPKKSRKKVDKRATPVLVLSDLHLDEVVDPFELGGVNSYNREIAHARLERVVNATVGTLDHYVTGLQMEGLVVPLLGDVITGEIHEELTKTNEAPVPETIRHWVPHLASALTYLADAFGHVHVPCVDGNHDRTYKKLPSKQRAYSSNAWIIYNWLADLLRDDDRVSFSITPSSEQTMPIYDMNFLLVHGDGFRTAGGVGGIYPSLLKYLLRKQSKYAAQGTPIDHTLMGHWHQLTRGRDFTVNGSLKGYDEYAQDKAFALERPQQAMFLVAPDRGITLEMPIHAE